jgi:heptosyltransferase-2
MGSATESASFTKRTGQWLIYALFRCVEGVLKLLPLIVIWWLGRALGLIAYYIGIPYRRLALDNLRIAFGREKSAAERRAIARRHFMSLFANLLCGLKLPLMSEAEVAKRVTVENMHHVKEAFEAGRPLTVPIMHASCWEIMTQVPSSLFLFGHKPASIYQPLRNPYLNALVLRRREKLGYKLFDRQEGFNEPISSCARHGHPRHPGGPACRLSRPVVPVLRPAGLHHEHRGLHAAIRTNSVILPMIVYDDGPARWRYVCDGPLVTNPG